MESQYGGDANAPEPLDFNSIDYDDATGSYLLGMRQPAHLLRIEGTPAELDWIAGPLVHTEYLDGLAPFDMTHTVQPLGGSRLLVFVNSAQDQECASVSEIVVEPEANTIDQRWSYTPEPCVVVGSGGVAQRLDDGNTLMILSSAGRVDEVTTDGDLVFQASVSLGAFFGYGEKMEAPDGAW